jgi:hypothetical protein
MADKKQRYALIGYFKKAAKDRSAKLAPINLHSQQWAAEALIESYGYDESKELIDYYFSVSASPDWSWFAYNSDKLLQSKTAEEEDKILRARLRQGAKKWLED